MIPFFFKSTICLIVLYGFYHFFLSHHKILLFNRCYLIFSLFFSIIIPLIVIPIKSNLPIISTVDRITWTTGQIVQGKVITENPNTLFYYQHFLIFFFVLVSSVFLIRFALNIFKISRQILKNKKVKNLKTSLILIEENILPYSFFKFIFVNQSDFENGTIKEELFKHEEAHCIQYHSVDIVIVELLIIIFWFNPAIWFFKKAILLNHEYYADNEVMNGRDPIEYQKLLVSIILQNNSNYLVSNFKFSLIKSRLKMMSKSNPLHHAVLRKILSISFFLIIAITLTFSQEIVQSTFDKDYAEAWWYPILKEHKIEPRGFNTFDPIFEMGTTNSIDNRLVTLKEALILLKLEKGYAMIESPLLYHDLDKNEIRSTKKISVSIYGDVPLSGSILELDPPTNMKIGGYTILVEKN